MTFGDAPPSSLSPRSRTAPTQSVPLAHAPLRIDGALVCALAARATAAPCTESATPSAAQTFASVRIIFPTLAALHVCLGGELASVYAVTASSASPDRKHSHGSDNAKSERASYAVSANAQKGKPDAAPPKLLCTPVRHSSERSQRQIMCWLGRTQPSTNAR